MKRMFIAVLACCAAASAMADCGTAAKQVEYRSTPPLLAHDPDSTLVVAIHAGGCVATRLPSQDIRRGSYVTNLTKAEYRQLMAEVDASGIRELDPVALRAETSAIKSAKAKSGTATFYRVLDENIIEFHFEQTTKSGQGTVRWATLQDDLLNAPSSQQLIGLASATQMFEALARDAVEKGARP